ncbi:MULTISPECIES: Ltp family lipoprotein [unclassified Mammaliicoccus]|uniref:Ltp family lipoprotein n=1 Tax=unclassified Mammaliicoccus TaxID=2803851 RepID=UPI001EFB150E|nr:MULTISPECIES: Ltp family lipoprotein [unclassified Mammaliicoccus]
MKEERLEELEQFQEHQGKNSSNKKKWLWGCGGCLGAFIILAIIFSACAVILVGDDFEESDNTIETTQKDTDEKENQEVDEDEEIDYNDSDNSIESESDKTSETIEDDNNEDDEVSREYKNALNSAKNYQEILPMSKAGLFDQLTSSAGDQYPEDAAQYAIDNLKADYKENALKAAENYEDIMPMSDSELFDQLTSDAGDKYTNEEAQYAIDNLD